MCISLYFQVFIVFVPFALTFAWDYRYCFDRDVGWERTVKLNHQANAPDVFKKRPFYLIESFNLAVPSNVQYSVSRSPKSEEIAVNRTEALPIPSADCRLVTMSPVTAATGKSFDSDARRSWPGGKRGKLASDAINTLNYSRKVWQEKLEARPGVLAEPRSAAREGAAVCPRERDATWPGLPRRGCPAVAVNILTVFSWPCMSIFLLREKQLQIQIWCSQAEFDQHKSTKD